MTTLSVLIGKGKANTRFLQATPNNELIDVEIPIDFGSEYIRSASRNIAHLVTSNPKLDSAFSAIAAKSPSMQDTVGKAKRVARSEVPVLILGETGTGKEVMAQAIHGASLRAGQPLEDSELRCFGS